MYLNNNHQGTELFCELTRSKKIWWSKVTPRIDNLSWLLIPQEMASTEFAIPIYKPFIDEEKN